MSVFGLVDLIFPLFFILFIGVFIYIIVGNITQWHKNNNSPIVDAEATIVSKRQHRSTHHTGADNIPHTTNTYYVTFEFLSGDRLELSVRGSEYGMLAEGDRGILKFQGTRYLGFERNRNE